MSRTLETNRDWRTHWETVPRRCARNDLFSQVERTMGGEPIPVEEICLLLDAIKEALTLKKTDVILDLCCGNGLITLELSRLCKSVVGVDYSCDLIEVARERHSAVNVIYLYKAAADLKLTDLTGGSPTKVCMSSGLQYFTPAMLEEVLGMLREISNGPLRLYFTDIPDASKLWVFYNTPARRAEFERRRAAATEAVGTWWDRRHLSSIFEQAGYTVAFREISPHRSTAPYRFDLLAKNRAVL